MTEPPLGKPQQPFFQGMADGKNHAYLREKPRYKSRDFLFIMLKKKKMDVYYLAKDKKNKDKERKK